VKWLYYRFIYRRLMKLAHRYGWHHTRTCYPEGDTLLVCDWCGLRYVEKRAGYKPAIESAAVSTSTSREEK
jgi:hypothetical protein